MSPLRGVCWIWTGAKSNGYGVATVRGEKQRKVHRLAYEALVGPVPVGLDLGHLCRNRACYNPAHLEPVTRSENLRRGLGPALARALVRRRAEERTHCPHGHPYNDENTNLRPGRGRECRTCRKAWQAAADRKRKELGHEPT